MKKDSIPFGRNMGFKVAFCNALAIDLSPAKRMIWVSGQIAFDQQERLVGKGDTRVQTEQVLKNIQRALTKLGGTMDDVEKTCSFSSRPVPNRILAIGREVESFTAPALPLSPE